MNRTRYLLLCPFLVTALACGQGHAGTNLLSNPGFDAATPGVTPPTVLAVVSPPSGLSAADSWLAWNNSSASTYTTLVPSTDPHGGGSALEVYTTGPENGVFQFTPSEHPAHDPVSLVSVDVYVSSGTFELGLGRDGAYLATAKTSVLDKWVNLTATYTGPGPIGDEIFLYSTNGAGADFFVDNAFAGTIPEPSTWGMMLAGFAGLAFAGHRAKRAKAAAA